MEIKINITEEQLKKILPFVIQTIPYAPIAEEVEMYMLGMRDRLPDYAIELINNNESKIFNCLEMVENEDV